MNSFSVSKGPSFLLGFPSFRLQRPVRGRRRRGHVLPPQEDDDRGTMGEEPGLRVDERRTGDLREILLRHRTLELLHERRGPGPGHPVYKTGDPQRTRPVQVGEGKRRAKAIDYPTNNVIKRLRAAG